MIELKVELEDRTYPVLIGQGARHRLTEFMPPHARRAAIVTQAELRIDVDPGMPFEVFYVAQGEEAKSLETVEELCSGFARMGLTRRDCVVGVGGGMVTDIAGFAASIYHRGLSVVHVATSLLAQVDAAIGGKTGVNLPEGKNLVGTFWQPSAVLCDTQVLERLPPREYLSGTGEMAKYHFLGSRVGMSGEDLKDLPLDERVAYCVELKSRVVAQDERDGGLRNILNYGHTLGHALEVVTSFEIRHGEAVAIGIIFAAHLARSLGRIDQGRVEAHRKVLEFYGLPERLPDNVSIPRLVELMSRDKKALAGLTFVLDGPSGVEVVENVDVTTVRSVLEMMTA